MGGNITIDGSLGSVVAPQNVSPPRVNDSTAVADVGNCRNQWQSRPHRHPPPPRDDTTLHRHCRWEGSLERWQSSAPPTPRLPPPQEDNTAPADGGSRLRAGGSSQENTVNEKRRRGFTYCCWSSGCFVHWIFIKGGAGRHKTVLKMVGGYGGLVTSQGTPCQKWLVVMVT